MTFYKHLLTAKWPVFFLTVSIYKAQENKMEILKYKFERFNMK